VVSAVLPKDRELIAETKPALQCACSHPDGGKKEVPVGGRAWCGDGARSTPQQLSAVEHFIGENLQCT